MSKTDTVSKLRNILDDANKMMEAGALNVAKTKVQGILRQAPDFPDALVLLARILLAEGDVRNANVILADAYRLNMDDDFLAALYGGTCNSLGRAEYALRLVAPRISEATVDINLLFTHADALNRLGEFDAAFQGFKRLTELAPKNPQYWGRLAFCASKLSLTDEKIRAREQEFLTGNNTSQVLLHLVKAKPELATADVGKLAASLGFEKDRVIESGEFVDWLVSYHVVEGPEQKEQAFAGLLKAAKKRFETNSDSYDRQERIRASGLRNFVAAKSIKKAKDNADLPTSVFILGPSRSGKTTVEDLLGGHESVKRFGETQVLNQEKQRTLAKNGLPPSIGINDLSDSYLKKIRDQYFERLAKWNGAKFFTYSNPTEISNAVLMYRLFPNTKFVLINRNVEDVAFGQFMQDYTSGNFHSYDLAATRKFIKWYDQMQTELRRIAGENAYSISFEDLAKDTHSTMAGVAEFLGILGKIDYPAITDDRGFAAQFEGFPTK